MVRQFSLLHGFMLISWTGFSFAVYRLGCDVGSDLMSFIGLCGVLFPAAGGLGYLVREKDGAALAIVILIRGLLCLALIAEPR